MEFGPIDFVLALINFLVIMWLLQRFAYKPILKMLDNRKQMVRESLNQAEIAKQEVVEAKAEVLASAETAKTEAKSIVNAARVEAESQKTQILSEAERQAQALLSRAQAEIAQEKSQALAGMRAEMANLAVLGAGKLLAAKMDVETDARLVNQYLDEFKALN